MPSLLYNSLCSTYFLSVRLLVLLFLISTIASACTSESVNDEQYDQPQQRASKHSATDTTAVQRAATKESATISLLGNPFIASRSKSNSLSTYFDQINEDFTVDAEPVENRHQPSITDTIYTIRFGDSMLEFYATSQSGELMLQLADIYSNSITLRNNLRVGMSQSELVGKLKALDEVKVNLSQSEVIAYNQEGAPISLHFYLKNGKVNRIHYNGYVD